MKIAVLSDGGWGTALAIQLVNTRQTVSQWGPFADYIEEMQKSRQNTRFLKGAQLPESLELCTDMEEAIEGADIILLAAPTQYARKTIELLAKCKNFNAAQQIIVNVAKGIENGTLMRLSEISYELLGEEIRYAQFSGPSHAEEVFLKAPTAVVVAAKSTVDAALVQEAFMNEHFRVYTSDDIIGVELGGALKNVLAIAAGISDGMELGDNAKAALLTRGVAEMARLGQALGGRAETFSGLSGLGDIIVTCTSGHSRIRYVGEELGKGRTLQSIIEEMGMVVAEGVTTCESAYQVAQNIDVETPIIDEIYKSLYEGKDPREAVQDLMGRSAKSELD